MKDLFWPLIELIIGSANKPLSNELYNQVSFAIEMLVPIIVSLVLLLLFYFVFDPSGKTKNRKWSLTFLFSLFIAGVATWLLLSQNANFLKIAVNDFKRVGLRIFVFAFSIISGLYSLVIFFVLSLVFRRFSKNNKVTPPILKRL